MNIRRKLAEWFYSPGAFGLWCALDDADNWTTEEHVAEYKRANEDPSTYRRKPSVATMWTGSGPFFFDGYSERGTPKFLGFLERWPLWFKFKKLNNRKMLFRFTRLEEPK